MPGRPPPTGSPTPAAAGVAAAPAARRPPRDRETATPRRTPERRWPADGTGRRTAAACRGSGPCRSRTASASRGWDAGVRRDDPGPRDPGTAPNRAGDQQKDRNDRGLHSIASPVFSRSSSVANDQTPGIVLTAGPAGQPSAGHRDCPLSGRTVHVSARGLAGTPARRKMDRPCAAQQKSPS